MKIKVEHKEGVCGTCGKHNGFTYRTEPIRIGKETKKLYILTCDGCSVEYSSMIAEHLIFLVGT